jgi:hypothetical protein
MVEYRAYEIGKMGPSRAREPSYALTMQPRSGPASLSMAMISSSGAANASCYRSPTSPGQRNCPLTVPKFAFRAMAWPAPEREPQIRSTLKMHLASVTL